MTTERLLIPLTPEQRRTIQTAAEVRGEAIEAFATSVLTRSAARIVAAATADHAVVATELDQ